MICGNDIERIDRIYSDRTSAATWPPLRALLLIMARVYIGISLYDSGKTSYDGLNQPAAIKIASYETLTWPILVGTATCLRYMAITRTQRSVKPRLTSLKFFVNACVTAVKRCHVSVFGLNAFTRSHSPSLYNSAIPVSKSENLKRLPI